MLSKFVIIEINVIPNRNIICINEQWALLIYVFICMYIIVYDNNIYIYSLKTLYYDVYIYTMYNVNNIKYNRILYK